MSKLKKCALIFFILSAIIYMTQNVSAEVIIIDAGHGGLDGGASAYGAVEKDITLDIALKLDTLFRLFGFETALTRKDGGALCDGPRFNKREDMDNRVKIINSFDNGTLISVHVNKYQSEKYFGAQMFWTNGDKARKLADSVMTSFRTLQSENTRGVKQISDSFYLYRNVSCPVLLAECGFISNAAERELLQSGVYRLKIAMAIFKGYVDTLTTEETENGGSQT